MLLFCSSLSFRYFQAAPLPSCLACTAFFLFAVFFTSTLELTLYYCKIKGLFLGCLTLLCLSAGICSVADGLCRFREYKRIKYLLLRYGFRHRILKHIVKSKCQRDAILLAAKETGLYKETKDYFSKCGYRWYHILPDQIVSQPLYFFHPQFLRSTFWPRKPLSIRTVSYNTEQNINSLLS